jgi:peptidoglycan/LPS O-acetylase OafA/YrhL
VLRCLGGFTLGMLAWRAARHQFVRRLMASDAVAMAVLAALLAGFARGAHDLVVYPLFPLLVVSLDANRGVASRAFSWPPIYWLGLVSYSVYLLHLYLLAPHHALLEWLRPHIGAGMAHAVTALLTFGTLAGVAALTYRWIEVPGRQWLPQPRRAPRQKMAMAR